MSGVDVGALLRQAREQALLSQAELADRTGTAQPVLSRFETGARLPSLPVLDRLLATCGYELAGQLVPRFADLHAEFEQLAAKEVAVRLQQLDADPGLLLTRLLAQGCELVVGGGWAAAALGLPVADRRDGLLVLGPGQAEAVVAALTGVPRAWWPRRWLDGEPATWPVTADLFAPGSRHRWSQRAVGDYRTVVLAGGQAGPPEERVVVDGRSLRVVAAVALTPDDGVRQQVLDAFLAWRAAGRAADGPAT